MIINDNFTYSTPVVASLAPGATATAVIAIEADSNFIWRSSSYWATLAGAAQTDSTRVIPLITVVITDTGSGRQLMNTPTQISNIAGHEGLPRILEQPKIFKSQANITVTFTNTSASTTYTAIQFSFLGFKEFNL